MISLLMSKMKIYLARRHFNHKMTFVITNISAIIINNYIQSMFLIRAKTLTYN